MRLLFFAAALLLGTATPSFAQDAFAGANDDEGEQSNRSPQNSGTQVSFSSRELRRAAQFQLKLDQALKAKDLTGGALAALRLHDLTGDPGYKLLADLATGERTVEEIDEGIGELSDHLDEAKAVFEAQGKPELYMRLLERMGQQSTEGAEELASERCNLLDATMFNQSGLRKFNTTQLKVFIQPVNNAHEVMVRHCVKRALDQVCAATGGAMKVSFARDEESANLYVGYDTKSYLWYEYQRHGTSTICYPLEGYGITHAQMKIPLNATLHRKVTEAECQEYCLREVTHALGNNWHPVSMERFTQDFRNEVNKIHRIRKAGGEVGDTPSDQVVSATGSAFVQECVKSALKNGSDQFAYHAGLAYLDRGNFDMARRYFCNATTYLNQEKRELRQVINRFIGSGQLNSAELIAFACINDDENNDENSPSTHEYNRVKRLIASARTQGLPGLQPSEIQILSKLYGKTPLASANEPAIRVVQTSR